MKKFLTVFGFVIIISAIHYPQDIPNPGFENWIDEITPVDWQTNNFPSFWTTVSRSTDSYEGSFAAKLEVANANGFPFPAVLTSTFPVSQGYLETTGYYQFHPIGSDVVLSIYVYYFGGGLLLGTGQVSIENAAGSYTQFSFDNWLSGTPDSLLLQVELIAGDVSNIGSYALIDQLSLGSATGLTQIGSIPETFSLKQNYPNPFNPSTTIEFTIPEQSFVDISLFDILGNKVSTLVNGEYSAGSYRTDFSGINLTTGTYFYRLTAGNYVETKKMILLK